MYADEVSRKGNKGLEEILINSRVYREMHNYAEYVSTLSGSKIEIFTILGKDKNGVIDYVGLVPDQSVGGIFGKGPAGLLRIVSDMKSKNYEIAGMFHSHGSLSTFHSKDDNALLRHLFRIQYFINQENKDNRPIKLVSIVTNLRATQNYLHNHDLTGKGLYIEVIQQDGPGRYSFTKKKNTEYPIKIRVVNYDIIKVIKNIGENVSIQGRSLRESASYRKIKEDLSRRGIDIDLLPESILKKGDMSYIIGGNKKNEQDADSLRRRAREAFESLAGGKEKGRKEAVGKAVGRAESIIPLDKARQIKDEYVKLNRIAEVYNYALKQEEAASLIGPSTQISSFIRQMESYLDSISAEYKDSEKDERNERINYDEKSLLETLVKLKDELSKEISVGAVSSSTFRGINNSLISSLNGASRLAGHLRQDASSSSLKYFIDSYASYKNMRYSSRMLNIYRRFTLSNRKVLHLVRDFNRRRNNDKGFSASKYGEIKKKDEESGYEKILRENRERWDSVSSYLKKRYFIGLLSYVLSGKSTPEEIKGLIPAEHPEGGRRGSGLVKGGKTLSKLLEEIEEENGNRKLWGWRERLSVGEGIIREYINGCEKDEESSPSKRADREIEELLNTLYSNSYIKRKYSDGLARMSNSLVQNLSKERYELRGSSLRRRYWSRMLYSTIRSSRTGRRGDSMLIKHAARIYAAINKRRPSLVECYSNLLLALPLINKEDISKKGRVIIKNLARLAADYHLGSHISIPYKNDTGHSVSPSAGVSQMTPIQDQGVGMPMV